MSYKMKVLFSLCGGKARPEMGAKSMETCSTYSENLCIFSKCQWRCSPRLPAACHMRGAMRPWSCLHAWLGLSGWGWWHYWASSTCLWFLSTPDYNCSSLFWAFVISLGVVQGAFVLATYKQTDKPFPLSEIFSPDRFSPGFAFVTGTSRNSGELCQLFQCLWNPETQIPAVSCWAGAHAIHGLFVPCSAPGCPLHIHPAEHWALFT